jgi:hypothetical protein
MTLPEPLEDDYHRTIQAIEDGGADAIRDHG